MAIENLRLAYESIFNLLDYFRKWVFARKQLLHKKHIKKADISITRVNELLDQIPHELMAKRSYQSNSFERSVLYLEQYYRSDSTEAFTDSFSTLQTLYANIGDYDALDGALKKFSVKSLEDRITQLEYSDNWKMAQDCLQALSSESTTAGSGIDTDTRLLKSLFDHELYDNVLERLDLLVTDNTVSKDWLDLGLEASILSGKLDHVQSWVRRLEIFEHFSDNQNLVNYHIGKSLLHAKDKNLDLYKKSMDNVYLMLGASLGVNKNLSLNKIKPILVLLHSLSDFGSITTNYNKAESFERMKNHLNDRLKHSGNDFKSSWFISSFRKTADSIVGEGSNVTDSNETWLNLAKIARKHNRLDLSTTSIIHAISLNNADTEFEYAKLIWAQGDHSRALKFLEDLRARKVYSRLSPREKAKIQLKYTKWLDLSNNSNSKKIIEEYSTAVRADSSWEKPYYYLGRYFNKLLDLKASNSQTTNPKDISGENEKKVVLFYTKTIYYGTKYLFEALPKLLTVWLDFAESIQEVPSDLPDSTKITVLSERKKNLQAIHDEIQKIGDKFPKYYWYTVFSQLLSRILHSNKVTSQIIISLAHHVVQEYPSHALWSVLAQYKSTQSDRSKKGKRIIELFASSDSSNTSFSNTTILQSSKQLFNQLISVSKRTLPAKVKSSLSLKNDFEFDFSSIPCPLVVPVKTNFQTTLPSSVETLKHHNPFPNSSNITINKFNDRVDVLSSMQRPRRLYLVGSDGLSYSILCKPNDDLRKDAKLMEFTTMVDHLLKKDYESEQRKLHISTYAVIPLNENYGIIEWVENTKTMRDILRTHYANVGISLDVPLVKKVLDMDCDISEKSELFNNEILTKYPPVLYQWFIENFPDPASWYDARNNYTRTTAVMSMVGYMLGLGDRHGENLLFKQDGGLFHVDFDCLFEKGLELAIPERVPFRLTHNMVDAFGITGVEGTFRKSCEVTLQLIRNNETILMNILESFLHDPIMDWSHKRKSKNTPQNALSTIRRKIRGILDQEGLAMGVQGQAEFLIQQATSLENLCQMYIGWMAFW
jgi:cell cycle checkpoint protein MEC1